MDLTHWYLFPFGIAIAAVYGATGISGANFWVPLFLLVTGLEPRLAFWVGLVTMLFGSASGLVGHLRQGSVRWNLAARAALVAVPLAVVGAWLAPRLPAAALPAGFGAFAVLYGLWLIARAGGGGQSGGAEGGAWSLRLRAAAGGLLVGSISVGLGALMLPAAMRSLPRDHAASAAGTTQAAVFVTSLAAALAQLDAALLGSLSGRSGEIVGLLAFAVPGVLVGGQIGSRQVGRLDRRSLARFAGAVLALAGALMWARAFR